jgi:hypothetical protein
MDMSGVLVFAGKQDRCDASEREGARATTDRFARDPPTSRSVSDYEPLQFGGVRQ